MWRPETMKLWEKYHVWYGVMRGVWLGSFSAAALAWLGVPAGWLFVLSIALQVGATVFWRRSWRMFRAGMSTEVHATLAEAEAVLYQAIGAAVREERH